LLLFSMLTRPIRRLASDMRQFREDGFEVGAMPTSTWDAHSKDEIHRLGTTFHEMAATLRQQYEKVRTTDELRRELISYVSHDLRTPLAALQGYLETWQIKHSEVTESEGEELIQVAVDNAHHISRLVEQLFELAHLDAENTALELEPVSITELAYDVMQKLQIETNKKSISLSIEPKDSSVMVYANIEKMERVFTNLIENSIRHCKIGGSIAITVSSEGNTYQISIKDDGCGINEKDLPHIFDAHFRGSNSADTSQRSTSKGGRIHSGLGLAITKRIIELHGSEISVSSTPAIGTCFAFALSMA